MTRSATERKLAWVGFGCCDAVKQNKPAKGIGEALDLIANTVPTPALLRFAVTKAGLHRLHRLVRVLVAAASARSGRRGSRAR